jgi:uncharacterized protein
MKARCPRCQAPSDLSPDNASRPFCSERCRLIDFGDWISERHAIPGEPALLDEEGQPVPDNRPLH